MKPDTTSGFIRRGSCPEPGLEDGLRTTRTRMRRENELSLPSAGQRIGGGGWRWE
jgi:hypothetical protein